MRTGGRVDLDPALRERLLEAYPLPKATRYARWRALLGIGLLPLIMLAELDREMVLQDQEGARAALGIDVFLTFAIATDLARRNPRHPTATGLAYAGVAARFLLLILPQCGRAAHPLFYTGVALALGSSLAVFALSPTPSSVARHLRGALSLGVPRRADAERSSPLAFVLYAVVVAATFPLVLQLIRRSHLPVAAQILLFVALAALLPWLGRRLLAPDRLHPKPPAKASEIIAATTSGLVMAFSLVRGGQHLLDAYAYSRRCVDPAGFETSALHRFLEAQRRERSPVGAHASGWTFFLLTALLAPLAEELIYRRLLQQTLRERLRPALAVGISSTMFGLAHVFVYVVSNWQTMLLGVAFGLAYEEAGLAASLGTHVLWNLWLKF
jgi:membrane protease YdiL (CAAX protease family)